MKTKILINKHKPGGKTKSLISKAGQFLRDRMFKTVPPVGYYTDRITDFIFNKDNRWIEDLNTEALYGKYLNQDSIVGDIHNFKNWSQAPGRKLTEEESKKLNLPYWKGYDNGYRKAAVKDVVIPSSVENGSYELKYPEASNIPDNVNTKQQLHNHSLGTYTIKPGNGYTEYNDTWDINPFRGKSADDEDGVFKLGKKVGLDRFENLIPFGMPFKIKGRVYKK